MSFLQRLNLLSNRSPWSAHPSIDNVALTWPSKNSGHTAKMRE
jgi:hypothetical protein